MGTLLHWTVCARTTACGRPHLLALRSNRKRPRVRSGVRVGVEADAMGLVVVLLLLAALQIKGLLGVFRGWNDFAAVV